MLIELITLAAGGLAAAYWISRHLGDGPRCWRRAQGTARAHGGEIVEGSPDAWPMVVVVPHPSGASGPSLRLAWLRRWMRTGLAMDSTRLELRWPPRSAPVTFRIRRRGPFTPVTGTERKLGSPTFDTDYLLDSPATDASLSAAIREPARRALLDLSRIHKLEVLLLASGPDGLDLTVRGWATSASAVEGLLEVCWTLCEAAIDPSRMAPPDLAPEAFQVVSESTTETSATNCHVCGSSLESDLVHCAACEQPYHRDCWAYVGVCSTFGCGSQKTRD